MEKYLLLFEYQKSPIKGKVNGKWADCSLLCILVICVQYFIGKVFDIVGSKIA